MKFAFTLLTALLSVLAVGRESLFSADFRLGAPFSDHMVLQSDKPVAVWGWADPGEVVTVSFAGQSKSTSAGADGKWSLELQMFAASTEPRTLIVTGNEGRKVEVQDVLVGEVWLCAGQSNMAMTVDGKTGWLYVGGVANAKSVVRDSANLLLRQFYVDWKTDTKPQANCTGKWTVAGPETTADFYATGYFFARELQQRLQVPVAILNASFGGSSVEGWTSREALANESDAEFAAKMNQLVDDYDNHEQLVANYVAAMAKWEARHERVDPLGSEDDSRWAASQVVTSEWKKLSLPASVEKLGCAEGGVVWLRREIDVPVEFGTAWRFDFPACRAFSAIYVNGTKIFDATPANGNSTRASRPTLSKGAAKVGRNTVAIKLHAYSGKSGLTGGAFAIVPFNPKFRSLPLTGEWLCQIEKSFPTLRADADPTPLAPVKGTLHWMPVPSQFNGMLHPLIPYTLRGALWYQGESNVGNPRYTKHLRILINDWRRRWGQGDFPFYLCQLPGYGERKLVPCESAWADCREMQAAVLDLPQTGLVNLIDTCEDGDLHPLNKQDVGQRLAVLAMAQTYGVKDIVWSGPVFESLKIENGKAIIAFKYTAGGLVAKPLPATFHPNLRKPELPRKPLELPSPGSELHGFILGEQQTHADGTTSLRWVNAQAKIDGTQVIVWSDEVKQPIAVRYAWADHPVCNLYNTARLPAFPFRSDK